MIERLDQLTLQQLIDLTCGDHGVLLTGEERPAERDLLERAASIMNEYKSIAMPVQARMAMVEGERREKLRMKEKCARICLVLCSQGRADMAREVLLDLDVPSSLLSTDEAVSRRSQALLDEALFEIGRMEEQGGGGSHRSAADVRRSWMSEIAYVMSVLKLSIDPPGISAAIYANLVRQAAERARQLAKMPPLMGMFM